jgi:two-component system alkaline phosphatase synthesis response regulator PhoP
VKTEEAPILVVDDDPDFVEVARTVLEREGYKVITATNGTDALERARRDHPQLVLLDVMMSTILDGVNVSQTMRDDPDLKGIPVIMVSSIGDSEFAGMFPTDEDIHIDYWLSKPVPPKELLRKINSLLSV